MTRSKESDAGWTGQWAEGDQSLPSAETLLFAETELIAREVIAMSGEEIAEQIRLRGLSHLVGPERIAEILADDAGSEASGFDELVAEWEALAASSIEIAPPDGDIGLEKSPVKGHA